MADTATATKDANEYSVTAVLKGGVFQVNKLTAGGVTAKIEPTISLNEPKKL